MHTILLMIGIVIIFIVFLIALITHSIKLEKEIYDKGIEIDGIVSKVEHHSSSYKCYVKYFGDDNLEHEGLLNASLDSSIGRKVRIKYISGNYDYVAFVSQELED